MAFIPFDLPGFQVYRVYSNEQKYLISASAASPEARCPACQHLSTSVHSYYHRTPKDLSISGKAVQFLLTVRKFRCLNRLCPRKIFAERLPQLLYPNAQRTTRLNETLQLFADNLSAKLAARMLKLLKMPVSPDTLLRLLKKPLSSPLSLPAQVASASVPSLKVISVDDFAFKRGRTYGTIIVNLLTHRPVELLPDRTAATLSKWLKQQPAIEVVSRDRSPEYAKGISEGAPQALQVADRWHIIRNWREVLEPILLRQHATLQQRLNEKGLDQLQRRKRRRSSSESSATSAARRRRIALYEKIKQLYDQGHTILGISETLRMGRTTVRKYLLMSNAPLPIKQRRVRQITDPYQLYLEKRWLEGCRNAKQLWREICEQGFTGTQKPVQRWASLRREKPGRLLSQREKQLLAANGITQEEMNLPPLMVSSATSLANIGDQHSGPGLEPLPSARHLVWLFLKRSERLKIPERKWLEFIEEDPQLAFVSQLNRELLLMIRNRDASFLDEWLEKCSQSPFSDIVTFSQGLEKEYFSIKSGITLKWSQGVTEGQVNKLKMLKRTSFGRGSFNQLRQRVLRASYPNR